MLLYSIYSGMLVIDSRKHKAYLVCQGVDTWLAAGDQSCPELGQGGQARVIRPGNQLGVTDNLAAGWRQGEIHQTLPQTKFYNSVCRFALHLCTVPHEAAHNSRV